jgi:hypothetical protein
VKNLGKKIKRKNFKTLITFSLLHKIPMNNKNSHLLSLIFHRFLSLRTLGDVICLLYPYSKTASFCPLKLLFFFKKKKREEEGGGGGNWGWLEPPHGLFNHPHGQGNGLATPKRPKIKNNKNEWVLGFWPPPMAAPAFGGGPTTLKNPKHFFFLPFGVAKPPLRAATHYDPYGSG